MPVLMIIVFAGVFIFLVSLRFIFRPLGTLIIKFLSESDKIGREISREIDYRESEEENHGK